MTPPRPKIIVLVGLPGSGKSTWVAQHAHLGQALSSDDIRRLIADDPTVQTIHRQVFGVLRFLLRQRAELHRPYTFVDATSLTLKERRPYIKLAELLDCDVEAVYFDVPLEVCQDRNRSRARVVPDEAIVEMARRMVVPSVEEGFSRITVVGLSDLSSGSESSPTPS